MGDDTGTFRVQTQRESIVLVGSQPFKFFTVYTMKYKCHRKCKAPALT